MNFVAQGFKFKCETCPDKCESLKDCVECLAFSSGDLLETFDGRKHGHADFCLEIVNFSLNTERR